MNSQVENWMNSACYDLETAEHMFSSKRYIYTVFMCHLAIEKILKANIQQKHKKNPSKIHDLTRLLFISDVNISEEQKIFLTEIGNLSVNIRYPEDFPALVRTFDKTRVERILLKSRGVFQCILKSLKS